MMPKLHGSANTDAAPTSIARASTNANTILRRKMFLIEYTPLVTFFEIVDSQDYPSFFQLIFAYICGTPFLRPPYLTLSRPGIEAAIWLIL
jgi:hypothetical protein